MILKNKNKVGGVSLPYFKQNIGKVTDIQINDSNRELKNRPSYAQLIFDKGKIIKWISSFNKVAGQLDIHRHRI